jgi:hypothetical protein
MLKRTLLTITTLVLSSLLLFVPAANADTLKMVGSQWTVYDLVGSQVTSDHATTVPTGGVEFPFPDSAGTPAGYTLELLDSFTTSLTSSNTLTARINVVQTSGAPVFQGNPSGGCPSSSPSLCPGAVRLFFEANLPQAASVFPNSCVGKSVNEYNFWWSNTPVAATVANPGSYYQFTAGGSGGTVTLDVQLDPANWSDLCGTRGNQSYATTNEFLAAIAKIHFLGLSFGSGYFFANGVGVDYNTGTANFQLISYSTS